MIRSLLGLDCMLQEVLLEEDGQLKAKQLLQVSLDSLLVYSTDMKRILVIWGIFV